MIDRRASAAEACVPKGVGQTVAALTQMFRSIGMLGSVFESIKNEKTLGNLRTRHDPEGLSCPVGLVTRLATLKLAPSQIPVHRLSNGALS